MQFHQIWWSILEVQLILSLWDSNPIFLQISFWFQAHSDLVLCIIWLFSNRNILFFYFFFQLSKDALSILHEVWHYFIIITSMLYFVFAFHFCNRPPLPLTLNRFTKCCLTFFQEPGNTVVCRKPNFSRFKVSVAFVTIFVLSKEK